MGGEKDHGRFSRSSVEDITALPGMRQLDTSPHLRPANAHHPVIPYDLSHPLREGYTYENPNDKAQMRGRRASTPQNGRSSRLSSKRKEEHLREEEIRALSAPVPIPKRPAGHNSDIIRRDSKKARRGFSRTNDPRGSNVSLPFQESIHSSMSGNSDQRGWAIATLDLFNPRPTIRYSTPGQYGSSRSFVDPSTPVRRPLQRKQKMLALAEDNPKQKRRVGDLAEDLDASDLRAVMERDRRRREKKMIEQQEKLDRKLRKRAETQRAEEERRAAERITPGPQPTLPTAIHPAFRNRGPEEESMGLGIEPVTPVSLKNAKLESPKPENKDTRLDHPAQEDTSPNPFDDPMPEPSPDAGPFADPVVGPSSPVRGLYTPIETPMEDPIVETAREVRLSRSDMSPPRSPITNARAGVSLSRLQTDLRRERTPDLAQPPSALEERRASETSTGRAGTWAALFRRGAPSIKRPSVDAQGGRSSPSEFSFVNTSRESMSRQAPPAHLVQNISHRNRSGTPVRTQSKFREDLPEMPLSPPDSRVQSPDVILSAQITQGRRGRSSPQRISTVHEGPSAARDVALGAGRTDSPVSPIGRTSETLMSASLASVNSEGSWLSGRPSKRESRRSPGRMSSGSPPGHRADFNASYEDLGVADEEYFRRLTPNPESRHESRTPEEGGISHATPTPTGLELGSEGPEQLVHGTAHRQATVVHRHPHVKSREGLLAEYEAGEMEGEDDGSRSPSEYSEDNSRGSEEAAQLQNARSINYGRGHNKTMSAGSAKLLDIPAYSRSRRESPAPPSGQEQ